MCKITEYFNFLVQENCEDKVDWCETVNPDCTRPNIKMKCEKYCNLCSRKLYINYMVTKHVSNVTCYFT